MAHLRFHQVHQVTLAFIRLRRGESASLLAVVATAGDGVGTAGTGTGVGSEMETVFTGGRAGGWKVWDA